MIEYNLHLESQPRAYELGLLEDQSGLMISIEEKAFLEAKSRLIDERQGIMGDYPEYGEFRVESSGRIGFGEGLVEATGARGWPAYLAKWPTKREESWGFSANLGQLFNRLGFLEAEGDTSRVQLMHFQIRADEQRMGSGASISAELSRELVRGIANLPISANKEIGTAMRRVMMITFDRLMEESRFLVMFDKIGFLHLSVPGNAAGLDPEYGADTAHGYWLVSHNVDVPYQQLSLLAGLIRLHELVDGGLSEG